MIAWIEVFAKAIGSTGLNLLTVHVIPGIILQLAFGINVSLRKYFVAEDDAYFFVQSVFSAVFPMRWVYNVRGLSQYCYRTPSKILICEDIELKLELGIPGVSNWLELIQKTSFENNLLHKKVDGKHVVRHTHPKLTKKRPAKLHDGHFVMSYKNKIV